MLKFKCRFAAICCVALLGIPLVHAQDEGGQASSQVASPAENENVENRNGDTQSSDEQNTDKQGAGEPGQESAASGDQTSGNQTSDDRAAVAKGDRSGSGKPTKPSGKKSSDNGASESVAEASVDDAATAEPLPKPKVPLERRLMGEFVGQVDAPESSNKIDEVGSESPSDVDQKDADGTDSNAPGASGKTSNGSELLAIQIRPTGADTFDALSYRGGLPGTPNCRLQAVTPYVGLRNGETLILSGGKQAIFVDAEGCTLVNSKGQLVGRLNRVVRRSPTMGATPPQDAIVIFDGGATDAFLEAEVNDAGYLKHGATIMPMAQDFDLHVEFRLPLMSGKDEQQRANSGVYLQSRYECQVLDSFAQEPEINGCGAIYKFRPPAVNATFPPLQWQTYDIRFTSPRWNADGTKRSPARITSYINGILVQDDVEVPNKTGAGKEEEPTLLPTKLQDHGDPVLYRNIWMVDRGLTPNTEFPPTKQVQDDEKPSTDDASNPSAANDSDEAAANAADDASTDPSEAANGESSDENSADGDGESDQ